MSDEVEKDPPPDRSHVRLDEPSQVKHWCREYGCTEPQLRQAIAAVGDSVDKVRQYFKTKSRPAQRRKIGYD